MTLGSLAQLRQAPDFSDMQRYPELRFQSTAVEIYGDELVVDGALTIWQTTPLRFSWPAA
jgi:polyisoprenoid-binding protein YceI